MTGTAYNLINEIIDKRSNGNEIVKKTTRTKLVLKGVMVDNYGPNTVDDQEVITKLQNIAKEFGIDL